MNDFFNKLYYRIYFKASLNDNEKGKLLTIGLISFFQTCNLLTLLNVFFKITSLNSYYNIKTCFIFLFLRQLSLTFTILKSRKTAEKLWNPENMIQKTILFGNMQSFLS